MASLSTHVLDTARGTPASGIEVTLHLIGAAAREIARGTTDGDGRIAASFGGALAPGIYELRFGVRAYFEKHKTSSLYDEVPVRFTIAVEEHYHVPLLLSPFGYSTYRGS
ncbi:MAG TPA: hydroxyisourate hydrolase [Candidatus Baltobacteraceae bacterium]|nr:hydroxyisourate hydrolase [Candidatus Baltobacteraceae bacterium]